MKKILSMLLALVMAVGCVFALVSCGDEPELDIDTAAVTLEAADYDVTVNVKPSGAGLVKVLSASSKDEEDFLFIWECDSEETAKLMLRQYEVMYQNAIAELKMELENAEEMISEFEEELSADMKEYYNGVIVDNTAELEKLENSIIYGKSGTKVWLGTVAAVEASK